MDLDAKDIIKHRIKENQYPGDVIKLPNNVESNKWIYEQLARIVSETNTLVVRLLDECHCTEMKTSTGLLICKRHQPARQCKPMDYIIHCLNHIEILLLNSNLFPMKESIPLSSEKELSSIAQEVYTIFHHAFEKHKEVFLHFELENDVYKRFELLLIEYRLMPVEQLNIKL